MMMVLSSSHIGLRLSAAAFDFAVVRLAIRPSTAATEKTQKSKVNRKSQAGKQDNENCYDQGLESKSQWKAPAHGNLPKYREFQDPESKSQSEGSGGW